MYEHWYDFNKKKEQLSFLYIYANKVGSSELSDKAPDFTEFAKVKFYVKEDLLEILLASYSTQK